MIRCPSTSMGRSITKPKYVLAYEVFDRYPDSGIRGSPVRVEEFTVGNGGGRSSSGLLTGHWAVADVASTVAYSTMPARELLQLFQ